GYVQCADCRHRRAIDERAVDDHVDVEEAVAQHRDGNACREAHKTEYVGELDRKLERSKRRCPGPAAGKPKGGDGDRGDDRRSSDMAPPSERTSPRTSTRLPTALVVKRIVSAMPPT